MTFNGQHGWLIAVEGVDNVGKTSTAEAIYRNLVAEGTRARLEPEFGDDPLGCSIRTLVETQWEFVPAAAQPLVIASDRAHRYESANKYVHEGGIVIFDRHLMTSAIYQGIAAEIDTEVMWHRLRELYGRNFVLPDLTLVLCTSLQTTVARGGDDIHALEFIEEARRRYEAEIDDRSIVAIDAELPAHGVLESCLKIVRARFNLASMKSGDDH